MPNNVRKLGDEIVEKLLAEFNEELRTRGTMNFDLLEQCPVAYRKELRSLMNVAALAYKALEPRREARLELSAAAGKS